MQTLREVFQSTNLVVVTHYSGLNVAEATDLRRQVRELGAHFKVTKNRLVKLAIDGTQFDPMKALFSGPTAIAYSDDPVAAAKAVVAYAKGNDKLIVVGGSLAGDVLAPTDVKALAALPSLDELRGQFVGLLQTPATRIAAVLQAPGAQLARLLNAYGQTDRAA